MSVKRFFHIGIHAGFLSAWMFFIFAGGGCTSIPEGETDSQLYDEIARRIAPLGSRNWIVIAEASFPVYVGAGVETISVNASSEEVFRNVLDILETEGRLQPRIWVCSELDNVAEDYAPGISKYRRALGKLLPGRFHYRLSNYIINRQVETAINTYRVLVIKTSTALPYSNVCIELDSGYWNSDSEAELRHRIEQMRQEDARSNGIPTLPVPAPTQTPSQNATTPVGIPQQMPQATLPSPSSDPR